MIVIQQIFLNAIHILLFHNSCEHWHYSQCLVLMLLTAFNFLFASIDQIFCTFSISRVCGVGVTCIGNSKFVEFFIEMLGEMVWGCVRIVMCSIFEQCCFGWRGNFDFLASFDRGRYFKITSFKDCLFSYCNS